MPRAPRYRRLGPAAYAKLVLGQSGHAELRRELAEWPVLDAGALIALERGNRHVRALLELVDVGRRAIVPASVLAQVWRGGSRSARLALTIKPADVDVLDESRAKEIGVRLAALGAVSFR